MGLISSLLLGLALGPYLALQTPACVSEAGFASASSPCCKGLVKDADQRCQYPTCTKVNDKPKATPATGCCAGLVEVAGVCRMPTLLPTLCTILGKKPTAQAACCTGLTRSASGTCARNSVSECTSAEIAAHCYGPPKNTGTCYCPSIFYVGT